MSAFKFFLGDDAPKSRLRDAQNARNNRAEIVKAYSQGKISRRDLMKMGIFTSAGLMLPIGGANPFVSSAHASGAVVTPTGAPSSPLFGVKAFSTAMPRFDLIKRGSD